MGDRLSVGSIWRQPEVNAGPLGLADSTRSRRPGKALAMPASLDVDGEKGQAQAIVYLRRRK